MIALRLRNKDKTVDSEPLRPKPSISKNVKVNPVDFLKYRDFNNKYCYAVHAISDVTKKLGFSPTTVRFLLTALIGSKAARRKSSDQIIQALSTTNFRDFNSECNSLVNLALNEWALLSTAGLVDVSVKNADGERLCRFESILFALKDSLAFKAEFNWLLKRRMGVYWTKTSRKDFSHAEKWILKFSKGRFSHTVPKHSANSLILATALQFEGKWTQNLEVCSISKGTFAISPTEKIDMSMLEGMAKVIYYKDSEKGFHLVGIPFKDQRFAIAFQLPLVPHKLGGVEKRSTEGLDYGLFNSLKLQLTLMRIAIPMFRLQTEVNLCKALPFLGINDPFDSDRADFSGISDAGRLHIECGTESSFLQVSGSGVRLTTVASLGLTTTEYSQYKHPDLFNVPDIKSPAAIASHEKEIRSFIVNQPFSVFVVDRESECVLYQARVKVPDAVSMSSELPDKNSLQFKTQN